MKKVLFIVCLVLLTSSFVYSQTEGQYLCPNTPTVTLNTDGLIIATCTITQATTFAKTEGQRWNQQILLIEACSATPQKIKWDPEFQERYGIPLPTSTRGGNVCELWGFRYHMAPRTWDFMATTPPYVAPK